MHRYVAFVISLVLAVNLFPSAMASSEEVVDEIFLLIRQKELLAFSAVTDLWVTHRLRAREQVLASKYDGRVAVVFTNLRMLGFSALVGKWNEERLLVDEVMETIEARGNVGAVVTNHRALGFSARTGRWMVERFRPR